MISNKINFSDFLKIDIRLGTIIQAEEYDKLNKPSILLIIDFGKEIGIKKKFCSIKKKLYS